jgi:hypothetical protein
MPRRIVLIGNGFDLAHGLKTSYSDFLSWYMCKAFNEFVSAGFFEDRLINIERKYPGMSTSYEQQPKDFNEVINLISCNEYQRLNYKSNSISS